MNDNLLEKVSQLTSRLKAYESDGKTVYEAVILHYPAIVKFINKFLDCDKSKVTTEILDNIEQIIISAKSVYESDQYCDPFDDEFYDKMLSKFKKFRKEPFGSNGIGLADANYKYDILSGTLDKVHFIYESDRSLLEDRGSLEEYVTALPYSKNEVFSVLVNEKKDGTSVTVDYKLANDGMYYANSAISRGRKDYGQGTDVSNVMPSCGFSSKLVDDCLGFTPPYIGIQYEMLVSNEQKRKFEKFANQEFANCRSAVAGLLRRIVFANKKDLKELKTFVSLVPVGFDILDEYLTKSQQETYASVLWDDLYYVMLHTFNYGDIDMNYKIITGTKKDILNAFNDLDVLYSTKRETLNHAIDGLVMTILDRDMQRKLGRKNNINQYQIAFKFNEQKKKTIVRDILVTTGNFGYKEILLIVDPVVLNGTTQFKGQVHSLDRLKSLNLHIGDEVIMKLSGDVIPYVYKDDSCKPGNGPKINPPTVCECGSPLIVQNNKMRCANPDCPFRVVGSLVTFLKELNAKGIGPKLCEQMVSVLGVKKPSDMLKLTFDDFMKLDGIKDAGATACMNTINGILSKPQNPAAIISSLGLDSLRTSTAQKILDLIELDELMCLIMDGDKYTLASSLSYVPGIDENAKKIARELIDNADELIALLKLIPRKAKADKTNLTKTILISGFRNDEEFISIANRNGYDVKDSGSKYDLLVIKDESMMNASKAVYARTHGRTIMTRTEFIAKYI